MNQKEVARKNAGGFTLIEILVVIGLIAILAAIVLIAINPARQFAQGRDSQRISNLNAIINAVGQRMADNKGVFAGSFTIGATSYTCPALPIAITGIDKAGAGTGVDLSCLAPTYIPALPSDPSAVLTAPDTGYTMIQDGTTGRITVSAATQEPSIPRTTAMTVTR